MLLIASLGKDVFERRMSSGSGLLVILVKANVLSQLCRQIVSTRVKILSKTDLVSVINPFVRASPREVQVAGHVTIIRRR